MFWARARDQGSTQDGVHNNSSLPTSNNNFMLINRRLVTSKGIRKKPRRLAKVIAGKVFSLQKLTLLLSVCFTLGYYVGRLNPLLFNTKFSGGCGEQVYSKSDILISRMEKLLELAETLLQLNNMAQWECSLGSSNCSRKDPPSFSFHRDPRVNVTEEGSSSNLDYNICPAPSAIRGCKESLGDWYAISEGVKGNYSPLSEFNYSKGVHVSKVLRLGVPLADTLLINATVLRFTSSNTAAFWLYAVEDIFVNLLMELKSDLADHVFLTSDIVLNNTVRGQKDPHLTTSWKGMIAKGNSNSTSSRTFFVRLLSKQRKLGYGGRVLPENIINHWGIKLEAVALKPFCVLVNAGKLTNLIH